MHVDFFVLPDISSLSLLSSPNPHPRPYFVFYPFSEPSWLKIVPFLDVFVSVLWLSIQLILQNFNIFDLRVEGAISYLFWSQKWIQRKILAYENKIMGFKTTYILAWKWNKL